MEVKLDGDAVRSCLLLAAQCDGAEIDTVEGMADGDQLHPLQAAFQAEHGLQDVSVTTGRITLPHALCHSFA